MQFGETLCFSGVKTVSRKKTILLREQKKLEKMVSGLLEKGCCNIGEDVRIIKQSTKIDKLIVDEMLLSEMENKIKK